MTNRLQQPTSLSGACEKYLADRIKNYVKDGGKMTQQQAIAACVDRFSRGGSHNLERAETPFGRTHQETGETDEFYITPGMVFEVDQDLLQQMVEERPDVLLEPGPCLLLAELSGASKFLVWRLFAALGEAGSPEMMPMAIGVLTTDLVSREDYGDSESFSARGTVSTMLVSGIIWLMAEQVLVYGGDTEVGY